MALLRQNIKKQQQAACVKRAAYTVYQKYLLQRNVFGINWKTLEIMFIQKPSRANHVRYMFDPDWAKLDVTFKICNIKHCL